MNDVVLDIQDVSVRRGDALVVRNVFLTVCKGEIVAVIGPNGAGKSTLLGAVMGNPAPESGQVVFEGGVISGLPPEKIVGLGITIVPEGARVFPEMTVLENLQMGSYLQQARSKREQTIREVFRFFPRLRERRRQKAGTLSGGERQMLALGRALMSRPRMVLLDEPSLGLAPLTTTLLFQTVKEIAKSGVTVLLVEQNVTLSLEIAGRAYVLENGFITLEGTAEELKNNPYIRTAYLAC